MNVDRTAAALANKNRVLVLGWLKDPVRHFPPQIHADLVADGVCGGFIADKLGVTAATVSVHLRILADAGFIRAKRIGKWTYFKRCETALAEAAQLIASL